jgi:hypothetical protein
MTPKADARDRSPLVTPAPAGFKPVHDRYPVTVVRHGHPAANTTPPCFVHTRLGYFGFATQSSTTEREEPPYARPPPPGLHRPQPPSPCPLAIYARPPPPKLHHSLPPPPCPLVIERPPVVAADFFSAKPLGSTQSLALRPLAGLLHLRQTEAFEDDSSAHHPSILIHKVLSIGTNALEGLGPVDAFSSNDPEATLSDDLDVLISSFVAAISG